MPKRKSKLHPKRVNRESELEMGSKIRAYRLEKGISQTELGNQVGVTFQQIQKYENGVNRVSATRLQAIAGVLGISTSDLYKDAIPEVSRDDPRREKIREFIGSSIGLEVAVAFQTIPRSERPSIRDMLVARAKAA